MFFNKVNKLIKIVDCSNTVGAYTVNSQVLK